VCVCVCVVCARTHVRALERVRVASPPLRLANPPPATAALLRLPLCQCFHSGLWWSCPPKSHSDNCTCRILAKRHITHVSIIASRMRRSSHHACIDHAVRTPHAFESWNLRKWGFQMLTFLYVTFSRLLIIVGCVRL